MLLLLAERTPVGTNLTDSNNKVGLALSSLHGGRQATMQVNFYRQWT